MSPVSRRARVAVVGGGSWGTTIASLTARNVPTVLRSRRPERPWISAEDAFRGLFRTHPTTELAAN